MTNRQAIVVGRVERDSGPNAGEAEQGLTCTGVHRIDRHTVVAVDRYELIISAQSHRPMVGTAIADRA